MRKINKKEKFVVIRTDVEGCLLNEDMTTRVFSSEQEARDVIDSANLTPEESEILQVVKVEEIVEEGV